MTGRGVDGYIPIERWGKDHFGTLLYIESRVVDFRGKIAPAHMRTGARYPTYLRDGQLENHDDWDCLTDIEAAGLARYENDCVSLTDEGWRVAGLLRRHRAEHRDQPIYKVNWHLGDTAERDALLAEVERLTAALQKDDE